MNPNTYPPEYLDFIRLFNQEKFFEAHEVLELCWRRQEGRERAYYHGLIQIAAALVHLQKGTPEGGKRLLKTASKYLETFRPSFMELDLEKLLAETKEACLLKEKISFPKVACQTR